MEHITNWPQAAVVVGVVLAIAWAFRGFMGK